MCHIIPEARREFVTQCQTLALGEKGLNSLLARMTEWRVAHIVGETRSRHNLPKFFKERIAQFWIFVAD